jgi:hypothetical protein
MRKTDSKIERLSKRSVMTYLEPLEEIEKRIEIVLATYLAAEQIINNELMEIEKQSEIYFIEPEDVKYRKDFSRYISERFQGFRFKKVSHEYKGAA